MIGPSSLAPFLRRVPPVLLVVFAVALLTACEEENTYVAPPPPQVTVQTPVVRDITQYMEFTGRTEAVESVEVRARVRGFLYAPKFKDGAIVEKGQVLYQIDPREYQAALDGANALLEAAVAQRDLAEATYNRLQQAADKGAVSKLEAIQAKAQVKVADATISTAEAQIEEAKLNLGYTKIVSPIAGRINRTYVTEGNLVGQGETTLLTTVLRQDPLYAYVSISERDLLMLTERRPEERDHKSIAEIPVERRQKVVIQLANGDKHPHVGTIDYIDNTVNPNTGTVTARAVVPNPEGTLYPGMFVRALAPFETEGAILVPEVAVQRDLAGYFVMTVNEESTVVRVKIEPGGLLEDMRVAKEGLDPDQRVIVNGLQRARPGIKVEVVKPAPPDDDDGTRKPGDDDGE